MVKTQTLLDKSNTPIPPNAVAIGALTKGVLVSNDYTFDANIGEIASRKIQNSGANSALFCIGQICDGVNAHGYLPATMTAPLDITEFGPGAVYVYSTAGTTILVSVILRTSAQDMGNGTITPGIKGF